VAASPEEKPTDPRPNGARWRRLLAKGCCEVALEDGPGLAAGIHDERLPPERCCGCAGGLPRKLEAQADVASPPFFAPPRVFFFGGGPARPAPLPESEWRQRRPRAAALGLPLLACSIPTPTVP